MPRTLIPQPYASIFALRIAHGNIILPRPYDWRLVIEPCVGEINGLPITRGVCVATNGISVAILQHEGERDKVTFGHYDWFIADDEQAATSLRKAARKDKLQEASSKERASELLLADFV